MQIFLQEAILIFISLHEIINNCLIDLCILSTKNTAEITIRCDLCG